MDKVIYRKEHKVEIDRGGYNNSTVTINSHAKDPDAVAFIRRDVVLRAMIETAQHVAEFLHNDRDDEPNPNKILDAELESQE